MTVSALLGTMGRSGHTQGSGSLPEGGLACRPGEGLQTAVMFVENLDPDFSKMFPPALILSPFWLVLSAAHF